MNSMEHAPAEVAMRTVELDLAERRSLTSTVIRPAWFMETGTPTGEEWIAAKTAPAWK